MALTLALEGAGKEACCYIKFDNPDSMLPEKFRYLENLDKVRNLRDFGSVLCPAKSGAKKIILKDCEERGPEIDLTSMDTIVAIDCAEEKRISTAAAEIFGSFSGLTINIDHHASDVGYAKINFITEEAATCQMLPEIFDACGFDITTDIAEYLVCGIMTDTGNLTHADVTAMSYEIMGRLRRIGAKTDRDYFELMSKRSLEKARLYGNVISKVRYFDGEGNPIEKNDAVPRIGIVITTLEDLKKTGALQEDTSGLVDFPLTVDGVLVSIAIMEQKPRDFRISLRSKDGVDVNEVAGEFGGGGHEAASGCKIYCELEEVVERLVAAVARRLP
ncbi:MAG: DHHA1 domain-containing protein [Clostridia bacterium]|nr:DHHA1 domain-containing protein [Clostridia bacterium]